MTITVNKGTTYGIDCQVQVCEILVFIFNMCIIKSKMRDTIATADKPVTFWFDKYMVSVRFNEYMLGYDADIYSQNIKGDSLIYMQTTGGKSVKAALDSAKRVMLDRV